MLEPRNRPPVADRALELASRARARAVRASSIAARHELLAAKEVPPLRDLHLDMASMHRAIECRQLAAARMHADHARRTIEWENWDVSSPPGFMAAVAAEVGGGHVGVSLVLDDRTEAVTVASDQVVTAIQDVEFALGEGPVHDVTAAGAPVLVGASALAPRWPRFAPEAERLGVTAVISVPLRVDTACLGALTVFNPPDTMSRSTGALCTVADALVHTSILAPDGADPLDVPLLADGKHRVLVHQASGMVAEQLGCGTGDALAVLRARAFAQDEPLDTIAAAVVRRRLRLS